MIPASLLCPLWDSDMPRPGAKSSMDVLVAWLKIPGNYARWQRTAKDEPDGPPSQSQNETETRIQVAKEIASALHDEGLTHRCARAVKRKIYYLEKAFRDAAALEASLDHATPPETMMMLRSRVEKHKQRPYYDVLAPLILGNATHDPGETRTSSSTSVHIKTPTGPPMDGNRDELPRVAKQNAREDDEDNNHADQEEMMEVKSEGFVVDFVDEEEEEDDERWECHDHPVHGRRRQEQRALTTDEAQIPTARAAVSSGSTATDTNDGVSEPAPAITAVAPPRGVVTREMRRTDDEIPASEQAAPKRLALPQQQQEQQRGTQDPHQLQGQQEQHTAVQVEPSTLETLKCKLRLERTQQRHDMALARKKARDDMALDIEMSKMKAMARHELRQAGVPENEIEAALPFS